MNCEDLVLGSEVRAIGVLDLAKPGAIAGLELIQGEGPRPGETLRIRGVLEEKDCADSVLWVAFGKTTFGVRLTEQTKTTPPVSCERLPLGVLVRGEGLPSEVIPNGFDALVLKFSRLKDDD